MANKDKLLVSAQKHLKKKALPKAIKDFAKVVDIDPNDMRSRQKLAELYSRTGNALEAFDQYETVAKYFSSNGFYLKAIAIYRQMQKLDPSQISIHARLAELNEKQGLIGNAMSEYRLLVKYYEQNEMTADISRTLEKMQELDPENLNIQIKLAEVMIGSGQVEEGREFLESVFKVLNEKQDHDKILKIYKKFLPQFPNDSEMQRGLAVALLEKGELEKGLALLQNLLRESPDDSELLHLLATTYKNLDDQNNCRLTYQHLLKLEPTDLDTREELITCCFDSQQYEQALTELEEWKEAFQQAGALEKLKGFYETLKEAMPDNQSVLMTLDSIYELTGDGNKIFDIMASEAEGSTYAATEETVSDSLLDTASEDMEEDQIIEIGDIESPLVGLDDDLQLEMLDEDEEVIGEALSEADEDIIDLEISDAMQVEAVEEDSLDLNFDLGEEDTELAPARDLQAELEEAEFYLQQGLFDEAERVCRDLLEQNPDAEDCQKKLEEVLSQRNYTDKKQDASSELHDLAVEVLEEGFPDLVLDSLDNLLEDDSKEFDLLDTSEESPVFRTDVDDQIAADDMESHYNLGIAYREMGLFDDAISEFDKAQQDPSRFVACQTLKGLCYSDKGDFEKSEEAYKAALSSTSIDENQRMSLHYDLGQLYENSQRPEDALASYQFVADADPHFRDIAEKIAAISKGGSSSSAAEKNKDRISFL